MNGLRVGQYVEVRPAQSGCICNGPFKGTITWFVSPYVHVDTGNRHGFSGGYFRPEQIVVLDLVQLPLFELAA